MNPEVIASLREHYSTKNFPVFVGHHGAWDIYANTDPIYPSTAAIPVDPDSGHMPCSFGPLDYAKSVLERQPLGS